MCVVGKDLNLKGTAIGSAFLKKCPSVAQVGEDFELQHSLCQNLKGINWHSLGTNVNTIAWSSELVLHILAQLWSKLKTWHWLGHGLHGRIGQVIT